MHGGDGVSLVTSVEDSHGLGEASHWRGRPGFQKGKGEIYHLRMDKLTEQELLGEQMADQNLV